MSASESVVSKGAAQLLQDTCFEENPVRVHERAKTHKFIKTWAVGRQALPEATRMNEGNVVLYKVHYDSIVSLTKFQNRKYKKTISKLHQLGYMKLLENI